MPSIAFIAGTVPLVLSHGAGAEVRSATGITVFSGMIGVTVFGLFLNPVFYVALRKLVSKPLVRHDADPKTGDYRSEEHTSELKSLMRISYAVLCLKKKTTDI